MLFWIVAAALTLIACMAILLPFARAGAAHTGDAVVETGHDVAVYKDQLAEIDRDMARGLIEPKEADLARAEIARRIIKQTHADATETRTWPRLTRGVGAAAVFSILFVSWGVYAFTGSPNLPGQPLAERLARSPADSSIDELIARAEQHLAANPGDARGWEVLGPVYMRQQRFADARRAWANAIRLDGANAVRQVGLGEAIAAEHGGLVTADALAAFAQALELEPANPKALYFVSTAAAQEGRIAEAVAGWKSLKAQLPADSPWHVPVERAIADGEARLGPAVEPGPGAADIAAAEEMSVEDRQAMIESMVAGLDARLRENPDDAAAWRRLIRSYVVLGRQDEARTALSRALEAFADDAAETLAITDFAATLGVSVEDSSGEENSVEERG